MNIIQDDLWLCTDCLQATVNDDYSALDYYYSEDDAVERMKTIKAGLFDLGPNLVPDFDTETDEGHEEFSHRGCDCCGSGLAGELWRFAILGTMSKVKFPSIAAVAAELRGINANVEGECDVRLQVWDDGQWAVRWGLSDYDDDHRGYWGASRVPGVNIRGQVGRFDSRAVARDLIEQAREQFSMS